MIRTYARVAAVVLAVTPLASGCSLRPDSAAAGAVAQQFHAALAAADDAAACRLLAPTTREELEDSAGQACAEAIGDEDLPAASAVQDVDPYVRSARVVLDGDVVFVSMFGDDWLVTAAGCEREAGTSYDCSVKGG